MAGKAGALVVRIIGDNRDLSGKLDQVQGKVKGFSSKFGKAFGIGLSTVAVTQFGKSSVQAFQEAELAGSALRNSLAKNKLLAGESVESFEKLSKAIQNKTAADDESVQLAIANLANFKLTGDQIRNTIPLVVDYARRTKQSVPDAARTLGTALLGNTRALKLVGIKYKSTGDEAKDFSNITELLRGKVGGFAEEEAKTTAVKMEILKNKFNDVQEVIGGKLLQVFDFLARNLGTIAPLIAPIIAGFITYKAVMLAAAAVNAIFGTSLTLAAGPIAAVIAAIVLVGVVVFKFRDQIGAALGKIKDFFVNTFNAIVGFFKKWGPLILTLLLGPIGALLTNFGGFRDKVINIFKAVRDGIVNAFKAVKSVVGAIWGGIAVVIKTAVNVVLSIIEKFLNAITLPFRKFSGLLSKVPGLGGLKGLSSEIRIPRLDAGGTIEKTGLAVVHRGERFSGVGRSLGGPTINITVGTLVGSSGMREFTDMIRSSLLKDARNRTSLGLT